MTTSANGITVVTADGKATFATLWWRRMSRSGKNNVCINGSNPYVPSGRVEVFVTPESGEWSRAVIGNYQRRPIRHKSDLVGRRRGVKLSIGNEMNLDVVPQCPWRLRSPLGKRRRYRHRRSGLTDRVRV